MERLDPYRGFTPVLLIGGVAYSSAGTRVAYPAGTRGKMWDQDYVNPDPRGEGPFCNPAERTDSASSLSPNAVMVLALISNLSRVRACTAKNKTLAKKLDLSDSAVEKALRELEKAGKIERRTSRYDPNRKAKKRTIYRVSSLTDEQGAEALVRKVRAIGRSTSRPVDTLCGLMNCTPAQLARWVDMAERRKWLDVEYSDERYRLTRTHTAPFFEEEFRRRDQQRPEIEIPHLRRKTLPTKVLQHFTVTGNRQDTDKEVADAIGSTPDAVRVTIGKLLRAKKLFDASGDSGTRRLTTLAIQAMPRIGPVDRIQTLLRGHPRSLYGLMAQLRVDTKRIQRLVRKPLKDGTLVITDVEGILYYSPQPLTDVERKRLSADVRDTLQPPLHDVDVYLAIQDRLAAHHLGEDVQRVFSKFGLTLPRATDDEKRLPAQPGDSMVARAKHCGEVVVGRWIAENSSLIDLVRGDVRRSELIRATLALVRQAQCNSNVGRDEAVWTVLSRLDNSPARAARYLLARYTNATAGRILAVLDRRGYASTAWIAYEARLDHDAVQKVVARGVDEEWLYSFVKRGESVVSLYHPNQFDPDPVVAEATLEACAPRESAVPVR